MNAVRFTAWALIGATALAGCASSHDTAQDPEASRLTAEQDGGGALNTVRPLDAVITADAATATGPECGSLPRLAAREGAIEFRQDGSARVSVWLENASDEDAFDYPGLNVLWFIENRYASDSSDLLLYGLLPHDRYEQAMDIPADLIARGRGSTLIVLAEPFTLWSRDTPGCKGETLEFSAPVP